MPDLARTALTIGAAAAATAVVTPGILLTAPFSPGKAAAIARLWARAVLAAAAARPRLGGIERLPPDPFVLVSNHQSQFDLPLLLAALGGHRLRFVGKVELFRIPVFGHAARALGYIAVDRRGGDHDRAAMASAAAALRAGSSFAFFAEGTRGDGTTIAPFKIGAVRLALETGVPLVPAAVAGTAAVHARGERRVHGGKAVAVVFGEAIPTAGLGMEARDRLNETARERVVELAALAARLLGD